MSEAHEGAAPAVSEDTSAADQVTEETQAQGDEQSGDDAAAATDEGQAQPKPKKSVQERIDELTAARREAERDRDFYREQALRNQPTQQPQAQQRQQDPEQDPEPDPSDYEHGELDARFIRDHATYHARLTFREEMQRERAAEEHARARADLQRRADELAAKHPDFHDVVGDNFAKVAPLLTEVMGTAMSNVPEGAELAYHFAKNPADARRIAALPPIAQAVELGKLVNRLAAPQQASRPPPKTATDAPDPIPQARGAGGRFTVAPDTDDFSAFEKQFGNRS